MKKYTILSVVLLYFLFTVLQIAKADTTKKLGAVNKKIKQLVANDTLLNRLYYLNNYKPLWIGNWFNEIKVKGFLSVIEKGGEHGLSPNLFFANTINQLVDSIHHNRYQHKADLKEGLFTLEILLSKSMITYLKSLKYGYTSPNDVFWSGYYIPIKQPDSAYYDDLFHRIINNPILLLDAAQPTDEVYLKIQQNLLRYSLLRAVRFTPIPPNTAKYSYKVGDTIPNIGLIADRLKLTGEFMAEGEVTEVLSAELLDAVNAFRRKNSLYEKQEIDNLLINTLNRPFEYYYIKALVNLERYRWKRAMETTEKVIEVNVAGAYLVAKADNEPPLITKVCVGKPSSKTPLLQSKITYINFNPQWNVPSKISKNEICAAMKKDPTYIQRHNMRLYKDNEEVDIMEIDWESINCHKFSYAIKQDPGDDNSLGRLKFMFSNPFAVYLHDTPAKSAFKHNNRAVSHGCVRIETPIDLAFFCMSATDSVFQDQIRYTIDEALVSDQAKNLADSSELTKLPDIFNLTSKVSLIIDYQTAYVLPNNDTLYFANDVYGYDEILYKILTTNDVVLNVEN